MSDFLRDALALAPVQPAPWLRATSDRGRDHWLARPLPTRKSEQWKYTPLRALSEGDFLRVAEPVTSASDEVATLAGALPDTCVLVFVNGQYSKALSSEALPTGINCTLFSDADTSQQQTIATLLGNIVDTEKHPFAALSDAVCDEGLLIEVAADQRVEQVLEICHISLPQAQPFTSQQRVLIKADRGAEASIVERYASNTSRQNSFLNSLTEIHLADGARLNHVYLDMAGEDALHIGGVHVELARDAHFGGFQFGLGGVLQRLDIHVHHRVGGSHCEMGGVYLPNRAQLVDFHSCIEHEAPHCTTNEVYRGIVGDSANAVFNGRIHIHPQAQKTNADLSNKNLLTSPNAQVNTKPELEIYADDVKCSHGATVAQLDEKSLYYLRSRGLDRRSAVMMLSYGFIAEVMAQMPLPALKDALQPILERAISEEFHFEVAA